MKNLFVKIATSVLGLALVLGWWTLKDKLGFGDSPSSQSAKKIPAKVWDGGGGTITIEAEATDPASVVASFETNASIGEADHQYLEAWEQIEPGRHVFTVEVPPNVGGSVSVLFHDTQVAKVGSKLSVRVLANGQLLGEETDTLEKPLEPGYGMQVEVRSDDFSSGKPAESD